MKFTKRFFATTFTLTGSIIGAGILGLPYVFSQSGFVVGLFWLFFLGAIMIFVNLSLGEVALRTKNIHQIPGYAGKYLGIWGKRILLFAVMFGIYSALLAYLIGEGQSFSKLFFGDINYAIYFAFGFWAIMTLLLREGLRNLKKVELWGVIVIIVIIFGIFIALSQNINPSNLNYYDTSNLFLPFGIVLFSLLGFTAIPELRIMAKRKEKLLKKAIIFGTLIPIFLYFLFTLVFVGVLGKSINEISTLSFGNTIVVLGIFTMMTSYFVLSFSLRDIFIYDLGKKRSTAFLFVSISPILIYSLFVFFDLASFIKILGIGGAISGGITGILILLMNIKAKKKGNRKPEFSIPINWLIIGILSLVFTLGVLAELFF
jgi:tyrosine-specific transport protein|tara:strand:+ start:1303 stop:2421 length:1119 start_codon:yes stop_codon:yes gene_type:complete